MRSIITITFLLICHTMVSQSITGVVKDKSGELLVGVNVFSVKDKTGTITDIDGVFEIRKKSEMTHLTFSYLGFYDFELELESGKLNYSIVLKENNTALDEVVIIGKTKAEKLREQSYAVEVVTSGVFKNISASTNDILNKVSGVNIRQSGGFGEDSVLSLNGLSGNQIRMFIDGIPMEFFGSSLTLNNFPSNLIEQIEVYKGVVPVHLSSDALGGAINITTAKSKKSFLDASYSYGSFNTNIASLNAQYRGQKTGFTTRLKSFYNYSDNNYKVDLNLLNSETGKYNDFTTEIEHFHDAYESKMALLETGFTHTKFADELMLGVMYSDNYNEVQQPEKSVGEADVPFGEVLNTERKIISTLTYSKKHLFIKNLSFKSYLVHVQSEYVFKDISSYQYDWYGDKALRSDPNTGESGTRKTYLTLDSRNTLGNMGLEYVFTEVNNFALSYNFNSLNLHGDDPFNNENQTRFGTPSDLRKQVLGASYTHSFFEKKFVNTVFLKYYDYTNVTQDTNFSGSEFTEVNTAYDDVGFGFSTTYLLNNIQFKGSFENAIRFPDVTELYGDGSSGGFIPNLSLVPEKSNNYNLGFIYKDRISSNSFMFAANAFVRDTENYIYYVKTITGTQAQNLSDVLSTGFDFSTSFNFNRIINLNIAGTYVNKVNNEEFTANGSENSLYKVRLPYEPYLYGNVTLSYVKNNLFQKEDNFSFTVNENYVHEFYYSWGNLGNVADKYIVPNQLTTDLEVVYSIQNQKYNFSFGVVNLFDTDTYDNLFQQNPGRSFNLKLRYFIN